LTSFSVTSGPRFDTVNLSAAVESVFTGFAAGFAVCLGLAGFFFLFFEI
jgi:hypothetical protein